MKLFATILIALIFCAIVYHPSSDSKAFPVPAPTALSYQLYYYWDMRDRESYFQVTNNGDTNVTIHIQVFDYSLSCSELDFFDEFTPDDTHLYDLSSLQRNNGDPIPLVLSDNYGFVVVTIVDSVNGTSINNPVLSGNFRIVDDAGYELRSAAAPYPVDDTTDSTDDFRFDFSNQGDQTFVEIVGISVEDAGAGVNHSTGLGVEVVARDVGSLIYDDDENVISCPFITYTCGTNVGLNLSVPNTKGVSELLCPIVDWEDGFAVLKLGASGAGSSDPGDFFVGFIALTDGSTKGGIEIFTALD